MSTTYARIIASLVVAVANIAGYDVDEGFIFEALSVVIVAGVALQELINRYHLGGIKWWGKRD